jgi:hypothetical protein
VPTGERLVPQPRPSLLSKLRPGLLSSSMLKHLMIERRANCEEANPRQATKELGVDGVAEVWSTWEAFQRWLISTL